MSVKQIKLVTGEEILCRVIEDGDFDVVIKDALKIVSKMTDFGIRIYTFRPFMVYQEKEEDLIVIRADKIVAYANPTPDLIKEYVIGIKELNENPSEKSSVAEDSFSDDSGTNIIPFKPNIH